MGQETEEENDIQLYSCGLTWGEPSSQVNVMMW